MTDLRSALEKASRQRLLHYLARSIHGFTIMARDPDASDAARKDINNRIHYLAGHLMKLIDPESPLNEWNLDGIVEHASKLNARLAEDNLLALMAV
ncbi:hypothetical protein HNP52_000170 [Sphingomonas kyeonggiensis]|uniref:Uncharacterized protein n=1 Tax=Sphingomonas kyeonggiensis TaxID=1268553 RepID=A0A7W7JXC9_9SPHN|nr:hypothetical protein [Sphingomonas kyeonggiensis]MBB4837119.1 hypothetical protein [Sphingomonas kyeonggiensis]